MTAPLEILERIYEWDNCPDCGELCEVIFTHYVNGTHDKMEMCAPCTY
jgi:hypothetical protein